MTEEERDLTSWNLSEYKINLIGALLQTASSEYLQGKVVKSFHTWRQIALIIDNRLTEEEKNKLDELEKNIYAKSRKTISEDFLGMNKRKVLSPTLFDYYSRKYIKYVNQLLKKVGLDIKERDLDADAIE